MIRRTLLQILTISTILLSSNCLAIFNQKSFIDAATNGDIETVQEMSAEASQQDKNNALALAATNKHFKIAQFLIRQGANIKLLHIELQRLIITDFIDNLADNIQRNDEVAYSETMTAISFAALLAQNNYLLLTAAREGHLAVVQFLLGMNINGYQLPEDQVADIHANNDIALQWAADRGNVPMVQFLLGMNINGHQLPEGKIANIHAYDDTPLQWAAQKGRLAVVQFLLGMNINGHQLPRNQIAHVRASGNYPLRGAVKNRYLAVACFLLEQGASIKVLTEQQRQLLDDYQKKFSESLESC